MSYRTREERVEHAVAAAVELVDAVGDPARRLDVVRALGTRDLHLVALVLAQLADLDRPAGTLRATTLDLVGWTRLPKRVRRPALPCGTHAAYERHRRAGEPACPECLAAESAYTRAQRQARRRRTVAP